MELPARSLLAALRRATRAVHLALHTDPALLPVIDGSLRRRDYVGLLRSFLRVYRGLAARLDAAGAPEGALRTRLRAACQDRLRWLRADLAALGEGGREPVPVALPLPPLDTRPRLLAGLYVVAGSALGGRQLAGAVERQLGLAPTAGCAFFTGDGARTGERWREVCTLLAAAELGEAARAEAASTAAALFEAVRVALSAEAESAGVV